MEGEEDRAVILGVASTLMTVDGLKVDLETLGVSVIPCMGKNNLDRPTVIFRQLGIPTYTIWDGDSGKSNSNPESNRRLLRLCGAPVEDWPEAATDVFACFKVDLATTLHSEIGSDRLNRLVRPWLEMFSYEKSDGMKNPSVIQGVLSDAQAEAATCPTLNLIVAKILRLKGIGIRSH